MQYISQKVPVEKTMRPGSGGRGGGRGGGGGGGGGHGGVVGSMDGPHEAWG